MLPGATDAVLFAAGCLPLVLTRIHQAACLLTFDSLAQVSKLLVYSPTQRATALEAMRHPFFDELRDPACRLPNGARRCEPLPCVCGSLRPAVDLFCCLGCEALPCSAPCGCTHSFLLERAPVPSCCCTNPHAGRPLPPLFNWIEGELRQASPELHAALQLRAPAAAAGAP